jgi:hypothetical protein
VFAAPQGVQYQRTGESGAADQLNDHVYGIVVQNIGGIGGADRIAHRQLREAANGLVRDAGEADVEAKFRFEAVNAGIEEFDNAAAHGADTDYAYVDFRPVHLLSLF